MESWRRSLKNTALRLFSQWAESSNIEHEDPKRIALAYNELMGRLNGPKLRENLRTPQAKKEKPRTRNSDMSKGINFRFDAPAGRSSVVGGELSIMIEEEGQI